MMPRGWCPSLIEPMPAADGLLVRIRPRHGVLDGAGARLIAEASQSYGNSLIELTGRGNLQLRGFTSDSAAQFATIIMEAGLDTPAQVIASPLADFDPSVHPETLRIADAIADHLAGAPNQDGRGKKFLVTVDGGGALPLSDIGADVAVRAIGPAWTISFDGDPRIARCVNVVDIVRRATGLMGSAARMRDCVRQIGGDALFAALGFVPEPPETGPPARLIGPVTGTGGVFGLGVPFGATTTGMLLELADLAMRFGDGLLRLTPWRIMLLSGIRASDIQALQTSAESAGLISEPHDPLAGIVACIGQPHCASANTKTRTDARQLVAAGVGHGIHVSGCTKGCAHPKPARLTLVGNHGSYDLIRNGTAGDAPAHTGLSLAAVIALITRETGVAA